MSVLNGSNRPCRTLPPKPEILNWMAAQRVPGGWMKRAGDAVYGNADDQVRQMLADLLRNPQDAAQAMKAASTAECAGGMLKRVAQVPAFALPEPLMRQKTFSLPTVGVLSYSNRKGSAMHPNRISAPNGLSRMAITWAHAYNLPRKGNIVPYNGSGSFSVPYPGTPYVTGTTIIRHGKRGQYRLRYRTFHGDLQGWAATITADLPMADSSIPAWRSHQPSRTTCGQIRRVGSTLPT